LTIAEYRRDLDEREKPTDYDLSRPQAFLQAALLDGTIVGGFSMTNVDVEQDDPARFDVTGVFLLGVPTMGDLASTWGSFYLYVLRNGLSLEDGRELNLLELRLGMVEGIRAQESTDDDLIRLQGILGADLDTIGPTADDPTTRFRRRVGK
jgi:hypothetical protein